MAKPIIMNAEMARAIKEGKKTVARIPVKPEYKDRDYSYEICRRKVDGLFSYIRYVDDEGEETRIMKQPFYPGDIIFVREPWARAGFRKYVFQADYDEATPSPEGQWRLPIHMIKRAARLWMKVTDVDVGHLQDVDDDQAEEEGCTSRSQFAKLWDEGFGKAARKKYGWEKNPNVWIVRFEPCEQPERRKMQGYMKS